ncbi:hypothetical protein DPMN_119217 [Dreissena polymorpha]|uniref:Secreted protein n=1 Tax=Dreissena polymorpha TaxID=45954 RepID=A0A9D4GIV9_DREPO|nr:hypothetical protein DPMN_119217 [Dreissena polymorpha]
MWTFHYFFFACFVFLSEDCVFFCSSSTGVGGDLAVTFFSQPLFGVEVLDEFMFSVNRIIVGWLQLTVDLVALADRLRGSVVRLLIGVSTGFTGSSCSSSVFG